MQIVQQRHGEVGVIAPSGRVDSTTSEALQAAITTVLDDGTTQLVIDLAGVEYISSAGLRVMLLTAKRLGGGKGALVLCGLGDAVRQVFDLAGLLPLFTVDVSRQAALGRLAVKPD